MDRRCRAVALLAGLLALAGFAAAQAPLRPVVAVGQPAVERLPPPRPVPDDGLARWPATGAALRADYRPEPTAETSPPPPPGPPVSPAAPVAPASQGLTGSLSVAVQGPATVAPGQSVAAEVLVRNTGSGLADGVRVELPLPPGVRLLSTQPPAAEQAGRLAWTLGALAAGAERRLRVELQPGEAAELALRPEVTHAAVVWSARVARPLFGVRVIGPAEVGLGAPAALRIQLENNGREPLRAVTVRVELPDGLRHPGGAAIEADVGDLPPGELRELPLEVGTVRAGRFTVAASARAAGGAEAQGRTSLLVRDARSAAPALRLDGPREAVAGRDLDLRLGLEAPPGAGPVALRLTLPDGIDLVGSSDDGRLDPATGAVTWSLPGGRRTVLAKLQPRRGGEWTLTAAAQAPGGAEAHASLTVKAGAGPALGLEFTAHDEVIGVGAETTCELRLVNTGAAPGPGVRVTARLPEGLAAVAADGPTRARAETGLVVFEPLAALVPRADAVYRIRVRGLHPGNWGLRAEVIADNLREPLAGQVGVAVAGDEATRGQRGGSTQGHGQ